MDTCRDGIIFLKDFTKLNSKTCLDAEEIFWLKCWGHFLGGLVQPINSGGEKSFRNE